ncbi:TIGR03619 family F420-dependent LLM class oxidoreductase [Actinomadura napierensis]|uniref:LLM class F420-dependent oxidoreductase n=1 Tax=Actinomadura napierensis TaxID=267854 RepID=A0ABN2ZS61_9ACTN
MDSGKLELTVGLRNFAPAPPDDWRHLLDQARAADAAGIERIFVSDHVAFGRDLGSYADPSRGGVAGGRQPTGPDGDWLEALTVLAAMSAVTGRVKLATNVLVAPLRPAVVLAKTAATIDVLSAGRFELGVGVGWQQAEYRAAGVDFGRRGRLLDQTLEACRQLWTADEASFVGDGFSVAGIHMRPKPTRSAGVPIWIGGRARPAVARRLARYGAGWIPWGATSATFTDAVGDMRELVSAEGGDLSHVRIAYPLVNAFLPTGGVDYATMFADVPRLAASGVTDFRTLLRVPREYEAARQMLGELADRFAEASRGSQP